MRFVTAVVPKDTIDRGRHEVILIEELVIRRWQGGRRLTEVVENDEEGEEGRRW